MTRLGLVLVRTSCFSISHYFHRYDRTVLLKMPSKRLCRYKEYRYMHHGELSFPVSLLPRDGPALNSNHTHLRSFATTSPPRKSWSYRSVLNCCPAPTFQTPSPHQRWNRNSRPWSLALCLGVWIWKRSERFGKNDTTYKIPLVSIGFGSSYR
jgi:hypothetical protein